MGLMGKASRHFKGYKVHVPKKTKKIQDIYYLKGLRAIVSKVTLKEIERLGVKLSKNIDYEVIKAIQCT